MEGLCWFTHLCLTVMRFGNLDCINYMHSLKKARAGRPPVFPTFVYVTAWNR